MEIITGKTGQQHVFAQDDAEIYKQILGSGDYVLPTGSKLNATVLSPTKVRIADGSVISQGRLAKIRPADGADTLTIDAGTVGFKRVDVIVAEYSINENRIEQMITKVVKGTPTANIYKTPSLITGNIDNGDVHQVPLWEVRLDGINFDSLVDRRTVLTNTAVDVFYEQALQDRANIEAQYSALQAELDTAISTSEEELTEYADNLAEEIGARLKGYRATREYYNETIEAGASIIISIDRYEYSSSDVFILYINGLRLEPPMYTISAGSEKYEVKITLVQGLKYNGTRNVLGITVFRY